VARLTSRSTQSLRIVVTGLVAQHPALGGVAWDYIQYPAGLHRLGHDVYYVEDSGEWPYTLAGGSAKGDWIAYDCSVNVQHLATVMERFGLGDRWAYRFPIKPRWYGMSAAKRREVFRTADLLINVSGTLEHPTDYRAIPRLAYLDSDPVFTQIKLAAPHGHVKFQRRVAAHDVHFTFGEQLSATVPPTSYTWHATRQPILRAEWASSGDPGPSYTTVMSWASYRPVRYRGRRYGQKDVEFRKFIDLPRLAAPAAFEVALNATEHVAWEDDDGRGPDRSGRQSPRERLASAGWTPVDAQARCADLDRYRDYVWRSKAEWSVAKNGYVQGQSGWFSCRSACYLAAGRPVVVQDTGFSRVIPTGSGLLAFGTLDEAVAAVADVERDYDRHARAAREIAAAYFDSERVLSQLVEQAMTKGRRDLAPAAGL
jgi:hypothetical protein